MKKTVVAAAALLIAGCFLVFGWKTYPAFAGDSTVFMPPAIRLAAGGEWANGVHPFLYPVPLFPMVVSWLIPRAVPEDAYFVVSFLAALNVPLCGVLFYKAATWREEHAPGWGDTLLVVASLGGIATWLMPGEGRPEVFASLLMLTGVLAFLFWKARWRDAGLWLLFSVLVSLMAASNPNGAVLFGLLALALCALRHRGASWWRSVAAVGSVPLLGLCAALLLYPEQVATMLGRTLVVGRWLLAQRYLISPRYSVTQFYVTQPNAFFYGFVLFFALAGSLHLLWRKWKAVSSPRMFAFFFGLFLFFAYYTAVRQPHRRYNLLLFAPLFFAFGIYYAGYLKAQGSGLAKGAYAAYLGLVIITSAGFARNVAMFPSYLRHGTSLQQARAALKESHVLDEAGTDDVIVTRSMWTLSQRYDKLRFCPSPKRCGEDARWFLKQQQFSGRETPQANIGDYVLTGDFFVPKTPGLFGIKIANSMRGYSFAIYRKKKLGPRQARKEDASPTPKLLGVETPDTTGHRKKKRRNAEAGGEDVHPRRQQSSPSGRRKN